MKAEKRRQQRADTVRGGDGAIRSTTGTRPAVGDSPNRHKAGGGRQPEPAQGRRWETDRTGTRPAVGDSPNRHKAGGGRQTEPAQGRRWETARTGTRPAVGDSPNRHKAGGGRQPEPAQGRRWEKQCVRQTNVRQTCLRKRQVLHHTDRDNTAPMRGAPKQDVQETTPRQRSRGRRYAADTKRQGGRQ
jgi:hypothetical protein